MKIAICDDNQEYVDEIFSYVRNYEKKLNEHFSIDCYNNPKELLKKCNDINYHLIYLDIEMNEDNGLNIANEIKKIRPNSMITFVTAYKQYFNESFHVNAFQYLLKPIDQELFEIELARAYDTLQVMNKSMVFPTTHGNLVLNFQDIVYVETSYREYKVHCPNGYHYGSVKAYHKIKEKLSDYHFFKIQRSFLINLEHIKEFNGDVVVMSNGDNLVISRKKLKQFKLTFFRYIDNATKKA